MNTLDGENSGISTQPAKRKRGRPRKDASLKQTEATTTPGSERGTASFSQRGNKTTECSVGQAVTGVIEAKFDSGYLLTVRIGNSNTSLRGVVFKPGHCAPITAENDVAPNVPMIRRCDVGFPTQASAVVPSKRKRAPAPVSTVAPVAPQPVSHPSGSPTSDLGDDDVHMVEPLSMLPPGRAVPAGQVFVTTKPHPSCQVGIEQYDNGSFIKVTSEAGEDENHKPKTATDIDTQGTSQASDTAVIEDAEESFKSSPDTSATVSDDELGITDEPFHTESSHIEPLFNYGTGRMTELLKAVQENSKERQVLFAVQPSSEFHETSTRECAEQPSLEIRETSTRDSGPENQGSIP